MGVGGQVQDSQARKSGKVCLNWAVMYIEPFPKSLSLRFFLFAPIQVRSPKKTILK
jgi:hypothetical protein